MSMGRMTEKILIIGYNKNEMIHHRVIAVAVPHVYELRFDIVSAL